MAETLTMESNVETTSIDNLSEEEKDSLQVGEKMEQAQEQLLAGKYKNAEELEKGYLELQQKLSNNEEEPQEEAQEERQEEGVGKIYRKQPQQHSKIHLLIHLEPEPNQEMVQDN